MRIGRRLHHRGCSVLDAWEDDDDPHRPASTVGIPPGELVVKFEPEKGEGAMHCLLEHPNIVKCYGPYANGIKKEALIIEYCSGGDIGAQVHNGCGLDDEARLKKWVLQIVDALDYLHNTMHVCHRDVKPANVFLDANDNAKLGDFGLSAVGQDAGASKKCVGTPNYISPEIVAKRCTDFYASDIWSLGALIYFMLTGAAPFCDCDDSIDEVYTRIRSLDYAYPCAIYADGISEEARDLVTCGLLVLHPNERLSLEQIRAHKWFIDAQCPVHK